MIFETFETDNYLFLNYTELSLAQSKIVYDVRNDDRIRFNMINTEIFPFENHLKFVESLKSSTDKFYWAVFDKTGIYLCSVCLNEIYHEQQSVEWGVFANPNCMGKGIVKDVALAFFYRFRDSIKKVLATVRLENERSCKFHEKLGFVKTNSNSDAEYVFLVKELNKK